MAMTSRLLLLRRGDHDSRLTEGFESLLDKESMTDVSITCGQHIVRAHRTVLSIFSPFFRRVFDSLQNPMHYPFVVLKDMPYEDLRAIIDLMYRGEVTVAQDQFASLKKSAKTLEVSELSDIISSYEEKNDIKPKMEDDVYITSSGRNTRKRGRPKRYCEDSDEEFKVLETPPQKRQTATVLQNTRAATGVKKPTLVQTINPAPKPQTATRGGGQFSFARQNTAIRGGYSAFQKPPTAIRGGHVLTQLAIRGTARTSSRGRGGRLSQEIDEDFVPQELTGRRNSNRRGRPGRPPRSATSRGVNIDLDLPMASSLPLSLPEPIQVDLGNIFPNYNLNAVTSLTSNAPINTIPVQFEQTIKQEPDSDSEVECIMSATSPLPSGVVDDMPELNETLQTSIEVATDLQTNQSENDSNNQQIEGIQPNDTTPEVVTNEPIATTSAEIETEVNLLPNNIVIKRERPDSPIGQQIEEPFVTSIRIDSENTETLVPILNPIINTTSQTPVSTTPVSVSVPTPTVISLNPESRESTVPLIRFIKNERISPPSVVQSFQSIAFSTVNESNEPTNSSEPEVTETVPVLSRVKIERFSPNNTENTTINISDNEENSQTPVESTVVSSSLNQEMRAELSEQEPNEVEITNSVPTELLSSTHTEEVTSEPPISESVVETIECSSSGQQNQQNTDEENPIDVQEIAFDCFYSNDDQQMQTLASEASTSTAITISDTINSLITLNPIQDINTNIENNQQIISTTTQPNEHYFPQQLSDNRSEQQLTNTSNTYQLSDNNVIMNSPIHSDEECMLLDSPQQTGYEVVIGSDQNIDDSMDENL